MVLPLPSLFKELYAGVQNTFMGCDEITKVVEGQSVFL